MQQARSNSRVTFEFSAGGIVFRQNHGITEILLGHSKRDSTWVFPKGHIADTIKGETKEEAAIREVREETGVAGSIVHALQPESYWFWHQGAKIKKTVYFFVMEYLNDVDSHDFELDEVVWVPIDEVAAKLTYGSSKRIWQEAREFIVNST
jgi:8-oxo-dGTP diphosphatase